MEDSEPCWHHQTRRTTTRGRCNDWSSPKQDRRRAAEPTDSTMQAAVMGRSIVLGRYYGPSFCRAPYSWDQDPRDKFQEELDGTQQLVLRIPPHHGHARCSAPSGASRRCIVQPVVRPPWCAPRWGSAGLSLSQSLARSFVCPTHTAYAASFAPRTRHCSTRHVASSAIIFIVCALVLSTVQHISLSCQNLTLCMRAE